MLCRLCKGTEFLSDMCKDGDTRLLEKANICLDLKICREDGLSLMICKLCKRNIKKFFKFKLVCLEVDAELKLSKSIEFGSSDNVIIKKEVENGSSEICSSGNKKINIADVIQFMEENSPNLYEANTDISNCIICELCGSIYNSKTEYRTHLSFHSDIRRYQCKFCPKSFTRAESRENHTKAHLGIQPSFICEICGRSSHKRQDLIRHMKIHSDERNHVCQTCGRKFKRSMDLLTHTRTHTGARPFKCTNCSKDYTSHSGLRKHRNSQICRELSIKT